MRNETRYEYDTSNNITALIDALGRRVRKEAILSSGSVVTKYSSDGDQVMAEYGAGLNKKAEYVYGRGIDEVLYRIDNLGNAFYYHTDHLGAVTEITDSNESVKHSFAYDEYGNFITEPGSFEATYFYAARRYDPETGP
jgi:uncharacterized protein RhaS with RHS repeats